MHSTEIIDVHAHVYPEGCFTEVLKSRTDFKLVDNPRGLSLLYRGSHVSLATLPGMRERTITISGASKTYSVTGWRIG